MIGECHALPWSENTRACEAFASAERTFAVLALASVTSFWSLAATTAQRMGKALSMYQAPGSLQEARIYI